MHFHTQLFDYSETPLQQTFESFLICLESLIYFLLFLPSKMYFSTKTFKKRFNRSYKSTRTTALHGGWAGTKEPVRQRHGQPHQTQVAVSAIKLQPKVNQDSFIRKLFGILLFINLYEISETEINEVRNIEVLVYLMYLHMLRKLHKNGKELNIW